MHGSSALQARLKLFLALSRTPHGLLDLATPALAALLWLGRVPPFTVVFLGLLTAFAAYTAVYALNDLVDYRVDRERMRLGGDRDASDYLDGVHVRHPLAQGLLSLPEGLLWTGAWGALAFLGAYALNPACAFIFILGCVLEALYCLLLKVTHLRTLISGGVKTLGGMAAVFAVDPHPSPWLLGLMFLWLFFWEIGGQNIPADWYDIEEDRQLNAKNIPVIFGPEKAAAYIFWALWISVALSALLFWALPPHPTLIAVAAALGLGLYLLLFPAYRLYRVKTSAQAAVLFNRASYYPLAILVLVLATLVM